MVTNTGDVGISIGGFSLDVSTTVIICFLLVFLSLIPLLMVIIKNRGILKFLFYFFYPGKVFGFKVSPDNSIEIIASDKQIDTTTIKIGDIKTIVPIYNIYNISGRSVFFFIGKMSVPLNLMLGQIHNILDDISKLIGLQSYYDDKTFSAKILEVANTFDKTIKKIDETNKDLMTKKGEYDKSIDNLKEDYNKEVAELKAKYEDKKSAEKDVNKIKEIEDNEKNEELLLADKVRAEMNTLVEEYAKKMEDLNKILHENILKKEQLTNIFYQTFKKIGGGISLRLRDIEKMFGEQVVLSSKGIATQMTYQRSQTMALRKAIGLDGKDYKKFTLIVIMLLIGGAIAYVIITQQAGNSTALSTCQNTLNGCIDALRSAGNSTGVIPGH